MNNKIAEAVGNIVKDLAEVKKSVLVTTSANNVDTIELTIDEDNVRIYVHKKGIRLTANTNQTNLALGLKETSYKSRCYRMYSLNEFKEVANTIINLK